MLGYPQHLYLINDFAKSDNGPGRSSVSQEDKLSVNQQLTGWQDSGFCFRVSTPLIYFIYR